MKGMYYVKFIVGRYTCIPEKGVLDDPYKYQEGDDFYDIYGDILGKVQEIDHDNKIIIVNTNH